MRFFLPNSSFFLSFHRYKIGIRVWRLSLPPSTSSFCFSTGVSSSKSLGHCFRSSYELFRTLTSTLVHSDVQVIKSETFFSSSSLHLVWILSRKLERTDHTRASVRLPQRPSGKESASQYRKHGSDPWPGRIPRATGQQSPCAITTEPVLWSPGVATGSPCALEPLLQIKRSHRIEKPAREN